MNMYLAIILGVWVGTSWAAYKLGKNKGDAIIAGLMVAILVALIGRFIIRDENLPFDLESAGLVGEKAWTNSQAELARKVSYHTLKRVKQSLYEADRIGDVARANAAVNDLLPILTAYNIQSGNDAAMSFRECGIAAIQLGNAMDAIQSGGRISNSDRIGAALDGCEP